MRIRKNMCDEEVRSIEEDIGASPESMPYLILADGILMDSNRVKEYRQKKSQGTQLDRNENARDIRYVNLPSVNALQMLQDPHCHRYFRRLLFYTRVHFDQSFHDGTWAPDQRGLYARTPELQGRLQRLSKLHNKILDALAQFRAKRTDTAWVLIRRSFWLIDDAVQSIHHRQIPDVLAILLLLQKSEHGAAIHEAMIRHLYFTAQKFLCQESPVRAIFECLAELPEDPSGHLYIAYDAYCRHIWKLNTGDDRLKALWSFNQASFPRAEAKEGGFFKPFQGLQPWDIEMQLREVEGDLGLFSTETFSLWHMVAHWFHRKEKFEHMEYFLQILCARVNDMGAEFDYTGRHQLNFDCMMSFSLLGVSLESQGELMSAMIALNRAIAIRSQIIPNEMWDPGKLAALRRLRPIARRLEYRELADNCTMRIDCMYASQETEDRQERERA